MTSKRHWAFVGGSAVIGVAAAWSLACTESSPSAIQLDSDDTEAGGGRRGDGSAAEATPSQATGSGNWGFDGASGSSGGMAVAAGTNAGASDGEGPNIATPRDSGSDRGDARRQCITTARFPKGVRHAVRLPEQNARSDRR